MTDSVVNNRTKIIKLVSFFLWQAFILTLVVTGVAYENQQALRLLDWYVYVLIFITVVAGFILPVSQKKYIELYRETRDYEPFTPSAILRSWISHTVSVIEITIFLWFGAYFYAVVWIIAEIVGHLVLMKMKRAVWVVTQEDLEQN